jgi:hypothetical protein
MNASAWGGGGAMLIATRERGLAVRSGARVVYLWAGRTYTSPPEKEL